MPEVISSLALHVKSGVIPSASMLPLSFDSVQFNAFDICVAIAIEKNSIWNATGLV